MKLTSEEKRILNGERGETLQKIMKSLVEFGELNGATKFAQLSNDGYFSLSVGKKSYASAVEILDEIISNGIVLKYPFQMSSKPYYTNTLFEKFLSLFFLDPVFYSRQKHLQNDLIKLGLKSVDSFSSVGFVDKSNQPVYGDILAWSDKVAVTYANSVLGARSNQNGPLIDFFCYALGIVPVYNLLTDEGRKAGVIIKIETDKLPDSQLLARIIAQKAGDKIPFIIGLEKFLNARRDDKTVAYLKDFCSSFAINSNLRLFHINNITEEAKRLKKKIVLPSCDTVVINNIEIEKTKQDIEIKWKNFERKPQLAYIGSPNLSLYQLVYWANEVGWELRQNQRKKLKVKTTLFTSPEILKSFKKLPEFKEWISYGGKVSIASPEITAKKIGIFKKRIITNSLNLSYQTTARFYEDNELLNIITGKRRNF